MAGSFFDETRSMKTIVNTMPGYQVYEYLLVLSPHEEMRAMDHSGKKGIS